MEPTDIERRRQAWSAYWATGSLHSCIGSLVDDPGAAIGRFWQACFAALGDGAGVLDLATGNGALPRLLLESTRHAICVDAVDLAEVKPARFAADATSAVRFHPGVRMEALPFADGSFDLVTSQFGIEYAQWPAALDEAIRVRGDGGRLAFVLHHAGSLVIRIGRAEQSHQQFLQADAGLLVAAIDLLPHMLRIAAGTAPDAAANRARMVYNEAMRLVGERIAAEPAPDLLVEAREHIHAIVGGRHAVQPAQRLEQLQAYAQAIADAAIRTRELLECALDEARARELVTGMQARLPGRPVDLQPLLHDDEVAAWGFVAG